MIFPESGHSSFFSLGQNIPNVNRLASAFSSSFFKTSESALLKNGRLLSLASLLSLVIVSRMAIKICHRSITTSLLPDVLPQSPHSIKEFAIVTSFFPNLEYDDRAFTACCLSARHLGSPGSRFQGTTLRRLLSRYPLK